MTASSSLNGSITKGYVLLSLASRSAASYSEYQSFSPTCGVSKSLSI